MGASWVAVGGAWRLSTDCGEGSGCRRRQMRQLAWTLLLLMFLMGLDPGSGAEMTPAPAVGEHQVLQYVNSSGTGSGQTEYMLVLEQDSGVALLLVGGGGGGSTGPPPPTHSPIVLASACLCWLYLLLPRPNLGHSTPLSRSSFAPLNASACTAYSNVGPFAARVEGPAFPESPQRPKRYRWGWCRGYRACKIGQACSWELHCAGRRRRRATAWARHQQGK